MDKYLHDACLHSRCQVRHLNTAPTQTCTVAPLVVSSSIKGTTVTKASFVQHLNDGRRVESLRHLKLKLKLRRLPSSTFFDPSLGTLQSTNRVARAMNRAARLQTTSLQAVTADDCSSGEAMGPSTKVLNLSSDESLQIKLRTLKLSELGPAEISALQARPRIDFSKIQSIVGPIIEAVRKRGDDAVKEYTSKFDKVNLDKLVELVADLPDPELDAEVKAAFDVAYANIRSFHAAQQKTQSVEVETMPGVRCKRVARAINRVGLYVPGGTAVLPSSALMLTVPAQIAGCKTVVVATPPRPDGSICPEVVYCAKKAGATHILKAGGAQAVAAMAWGTDSCPKVDKILGPGNQYVTAAKMLLQNSEAMISMDMPAGPSEVLVIADKYASPVYVAADLLSQAEHGADSQVVLVAVGDDVDVEAIEAEVEKQCNALPRGSIASKAIENSFTLVVSTKAEACAFSNLYAPEHLIVNVENAASWLDSLDNAGSVFLGRWTPESVGDYASGTNHVLPTYGYARMYGGVSLDSFVKYMTVQSLSSEGLIALGPSVVKMALVEGLDAHARAVTLRLKDLKVSK